MSVEPITQYSGCHNLYLCCQNSLCCEHKIMIRFVSAQRYRVYSLPRLTGSILNAIKSINPSSYLTRKKIKRKNKVILGQFEWSCKQEATKIRLTQLKYSRGTRLCNSHSRWWLFTQFCWVPKEGWRKYVAVFSCCVCSSEENFSKINIKCASGRK